MNRFSKSTKASPFPLIESCLLPTVFPHFESSHRTSDAWHTSSQRIEPQRAIDSLCNASGGVS